MHRLWNLDCHSIIPVKTVNLSMKPRTYDTIAEVPAFTAPRLNPAYF